VKIINYSKKSPIKFCALAFFCLSTILLVSESVFASGDNSAGHTDEIVPILFALVVILLGAKLGGHIAVKCKLPEVLGELFFGMLIGNLTLIGFDGLQYLAHDSVIHTFSELGVILLLFEVGLESDVQEMRKVGKSSFLVATLGVIAPFFLGWGVSAYFFPEEARLVHVFVGATLVATSVGITARVLKDLGKIQASESKIILGAAVIDDVMGLIVLAVVTGIIQQGSDFEWTTGVVITLKAIGFLVGALVIGNYASPVLFRGAAKLKSKGVLLATSLVVCFGMSYLASLVGLAPIIGAFTAGLILDPVDYEELSLRNERKTVEHLIAPLTAVFVPIFFVIMGANVQFSDFLDNPEILTFALALTAAAIIGKQICALGVLEKGLDRIAVGIGMIPRGEVGLIFAGIGAALRIGGEPVINRPTYGAVVIMVVITTMITPPLLTFRFRRKN